MRALTLLAIAFCLAASHLPAQTTMLTPLVNCRPTATDKADNSEVLIVQPSRHGSVTFLLQIDGDAGFVGFPILSTETTGYGATNADIFNTFCHLDLHDWLVFPNPLIGNLFSWNQTIYIFDGVNPVQAPFFEISNPVFEGIAMYIQSAQVDLSLPLTGPSGAVATASFSRGLTLINLEPTGEDVAVPAGSAPLSQAGRALATGDIDGDGFDDLIVGAPTDAAGGVPSAGRVYIYLGSADGLEAHPYIIEEPDLSTAFQGIIPPQATGPESGALFGAALALGDLDGDAEGELVIGCPGSSALQGDPLVGEVFVITDFTGLFQTTPLAAPTLITPSPNGVIMLDRDGLLHPGAQDHEGDRFGFSLAIGDVNGDMADDVIVGTPFKNLDGQTEIDKGAVYVYEGPFVPGFAPLQSQAFYVEDDVVGDNEEFGFSVAAADMDDDGLSEILVGVPGQMTGGATRAGKAVILSLDPQTSTLLPIQTFTSANPQAFAAFGQAVAAGDLDGNGFLDLVVGSDEDSMPQQPPPPLAGGTGALLQSGRVHVFQLDTNYALLHAESFVSPDEEAFGRFGRALAVGDINDDGLDDVVVGSPGASFSGIQGHGRTYVFMGTREIPFENTWRTITLESNTSGLAASGTSLALGDFSGLGVLDVAIGEPIAPSGLIVAAGNVLVFENLLTRRANQPIGF